MCTKRTGSTFLLDLLSQKKMLPKYKNIAIGAKATQFHLQRNGTWSIPHKSYPSSDIRPWLGLKYQLFLRPVCVRAPIVPSPDCQGLADKDYIIWLLSKQLELFPLRSVLQSLDIRFWEFIFSFNHSKWTRYQNLRSTNITFQFGSNWVLNLRQEIVHDDR